MEEIDYSVTMRSDVNAEAQRTTGLRNLKAIDLQKTATVKVEYSVEHSCDDESSTKPPILGPVTVEIPAGGSALQVMETAAEKYGSHYNFTGKYSDGGGLGFDIETINGFPSDETQECHWEFLIRLPDGTIKPSKLRVSNYYFDTDQYGMIMRFTSTPTTKVVKVDYMIKCKGNPVKPVSVSIPIGGSALQVMENAADRYGTEYYFTAKYYGKFDGFIIDKINGIAGDKTQYWKFLIKSPDGSIGPPDVGVLIYTFKTSGYGMIMRLTPEN